MSKVLLIESDKLFAKTIAVLLKGAGHQINAATDAGGAVAAADATNPDVIILDLLLAGHSGAEFLYELRSYPDWQKVPVIIYTSLPPSEAPVNSGCFEQLDVAYYFYKPQTKLTDLLSAVNALAAVAA